MSLPCAPILCGGPVLPDRKCLRRCREKEWREVVPDGSRPGPSGSVEQPNLGSAVGTADHGWAAIQRKFVSIAPGDVGEAVTSVHRKPSGAVIGAASWVFLGNNKSVACSQA